MSPTEGAAQPVTGPHRVYVGSIPGGVTLDVSHFVETLLVDLAARYENDPENVGEFLCAIANAARHGRDGGDVDAAEDREHLVDQLLEELGGAQQYVYGDQVRRLADTLLRCAERLHGTGTAGRRGAAA